MKLWQHLSTQISQHSAQPFQIDQQHSLGGGCINTAYKISDHQRHYFVKLNTIEHRNMFETEALALQELHELAAVRVPRPICSGTFESHAYLVLEYLDLSGRFDSQRLGQQLASMHHISSAQFGWTQNNVIGATPQSNTPTTNWIDFWREQRLLPQLQLAQHNGYGTELSPPVEKLLIGFECLFSQYTPSPSLLHGDLWGGNASGLQDATPVIFDPALYYGDRETDIAMTYLFGGFDTHFYAAYNEAWPLDDGFATRKTLYNLYHIINHLNLFGGGYLSQAVSMTEQLLAEI